MTRGAAGRVPGVQQQEGDAQPRVRGHGGQLWRGRGQVSCDWWRAAVLTSHWSGGSPPGTGWGWTPTCRATAASSASEVNMTRVVQTCHESRVQARSTSASTAARVTLAACSATAGRRSCAWCRPSRCGAEGRRPHRSPATAQVFLLPDAVSLDIGALCEPLSCILHGWDRLRWILGH